MVVPTANEASCLLLSPVRLSKRANTSSVNRVWRHVSTKEDISTVRGSISYLPFDDFVRRYTNYTTPGVENHANLGRNDLLSCSNRRKQETANLFLLIYYNSISQKSSRLAVNRNHRNNAVPNYEVDTVADCVLGSSPMRLQRIRLAGSGYRQSRYAFRIP